MTKRRRTVLTIAAMGAGPFIVLLAPCTWAGEKPASKVPVEAPAKKPLAEPEKPLAEPEKPVAEPVKPVAEPGKALVEEPDKALVPAREKAPAGLGAAYRSGRIITGAAEHRIIHFTFDDGPDPRHTPLLLDKLDQAGVKATFFFSTSRFKERGRRSLKAIEVAREVVRRGHSVGSHSFDHARMARMDRSAVQRQLDESERRFRRVFGARTFLFRPPFGSRSRIVDRLLWQRGYTTVLWNIGLADWVSRPAADILATYKKVIDRLEKKEGQRGGVVLLHDTRPWSIQAFELIIAYIRERNCELLQQGEELYDVVDDLTLFFTPRDDDDPGAHAPAAPIDRDLFNTRQARLREETRKLCRESL